VLRRMLRSRSEPFLTWNTARNQSAITFAMASPHARDSRRPHATLKSQAWARLVVPLPARLATDVALRSMVVGGAAPFTG
jgi:hypothetical protein